MNLNELIKLTKTRQELGGVGRVLWKMQAYDANPSALDRSWSTWIEVSARRKPRRSRSRRGRNRLNEYPRSSALPSGECNKWCPVLLEG